MNLPMLVRILNYPTLSLEQLVEKAVDGGREGVMTWCFSETDSP
jgi:PTS system ascorbate-specific IIA component